MRIVSFADCIFGVYHCFAKKKSSVVVHPEFESHLED